MDRLVHFTVPVTQKTQHEQCKQKYVVYYYLCGTFISTYASTSLFSSSIAFMQLSDAAASKAGAM